MGLLRMTRSGIQGQELKQDGETIRLQVSSGGQHMLLTTDRFPHGGGKLVRNHDVSGEGGRSLVGPGGWRYRLSIQPWQRVVRIKVNYGMIPY